MNHRLFKCFLPFVLSGLFFVSGCSKGDDTKKHNVIFVDPINISYGSDISSCYYITRVDSHVVSASMLDVKNNRIYVDNISIVCPPVSYTDLGKIELTYLIDDIAYVTHANIIDDIAPVISAPENLTFEVGEMGTFDKYFQISDNYDKADDITVTFDSNNLDVNKKGTYHISVNAIDSNGNQAELDSVVTIIDTKGDEEARKREEEKRKQEKQDEEKRNDEKNPQYNSGTPQSPSSGTGSSSGQGGSSYVPPSQPPVYNVPACSYKAFYESQYGTLINAYNAAISYYNSCSSASVLPINDSDGNTIGWSVG